MKPSAATATAKLCAPYRAWPLLVLLAALMIGCRDRAPNAVHVRIDRGPRDTSYALTWRVQVRVDTASGRVKALITSESKDGEQFRQILQYVSEQCLVFDELNWECGVPGPGDAMYTGLIMKNGKLREKIEGTMREYSAESR